MAVSALQIKQLVSSTDKYRAGSSKSAMRLDELGFDPIGELVVHYRQLQKEEELMRAWRDGDYIPCNADGKPLRYSVHAHMTLMTQFERVASQLLRYGYGRVPETVNLETHDTGGLVINLTSENDDSSYE